MSADPSSGSDSGSRLPPGVPPVPMATPRELISFERVCNAVVELVVVADQNRRVIWTNEAAREHLGFDPLHLVGRPLQSLFAEEDILHRVSVDAVFVDGVFHDLGVVMVNSRGDSAVFVLSGRLMKLSSGEGCVLIARPAGAMQTLLAETSRWAAREKAKADALTAASRELEIANQLQTSMLPRTWELKGIELGAQMCPATVIGGDYYDVVPTDDGCWIGIGDVAGHGLQAGLIMLMIQSMTSAVLQGQPDISPSRALTVLNQVLYDNVRNRLRSDQHATLSLLRLHKDGRLVFAGAHEDLLIHRARTGRSEVVRTEGPWVGAIPSIAGKVQDQTVVMEPGDLLLLHTDGVTEARNASGTLFGLDGLQTALDMYGAATPAVVVERLVDIVNQWVVDQKDDVTMLALRFSP